MKSIFKDLLTWVQGRSKPDRVSASDPQTGLKAWAQWRASKNDSDSFETALVKNGTGTFRDWLTQHVDKSCTYVSLGKQYWQTSAEKLATDQANCLAEAERFLIHEFNLLGSGTYVPICPDRPTIDGYQPIDWVLDPVQNLRFPQGFHYKDWDLMRDRPGNADVKFPWELARSQHFLTLGQAWVVSEDARFAQEVLRQIKDFDETNKVGFGVNWTCTMDVGIRAANWAIALDLIKSCDDLDEDALAGAYACVYEHGRFVRDNLENHYEITSNHYLSNIVGLHFVAAIFQDVGEGPDWLTFVHESVPKEIDIQILPDGADFESAIPYHRLVLELFLASYRMAQHLEVPYSAHYSERLEQMADYLAGTLRPDGRMPVLGDCDDGRLMIASNALSWDRQDPRHIFYPAALTLNRDRWLDISAPCSLWEALWWGFDVSLLDPHEMHLTEHSTLYPDAGVAISRSQDQYLMVTNPIVGTVGFGNHKHNEQLSFEYHDQGVPLIVDTGSYVYTGDPAGRNLFRSTAYHNTLEIDGVEQNEFNPEWLFRMFEKANPEHVTFTSEGEVTTYCGRHHGYEEQLDSGVCHQRTFIHDRASASLVLLDELSGAGQHDLVWNFHLDPGVQPELNGQGSVRLVSEGKQWVLRYEGEIDEVAVLDSWVSPSYGVRKTSQQLRLSSRNVSISANQWRFELARVVD